MLFAWATVRHTPDSELVSRIKAGDRGAYRIIVERYQDKVYSQCLRQLGDEQIAAETAQDVFLALYRSIHKFRGDAQLSTWIYRVVINHCKNRRLYRRRRQTNAHEPLEGNRRDEEQPARQLAHEGPGSDHTAHRTEAEILIHEALAELDEEQRNIILLRDLQDLGYEEISEILDLPRGTVKSRLHRARASLARVLQRRVQREDVI